MSIPSDVVVDFEKKGDYLLMHARGIRTRDTVIALTKEVFRRVIAEKMAKVMLDVCELKGRLSVVDDYYLVTELFEQLRGKGIKRAAIIDEEESPIHEWFLELVAHNRGYNFRIFTDEKDAAQWLET